MKWFCLTDPKGVPEVDDKGAVLSFTSDKDATEYRDREIRHRHNHDKQGVDYWMNLSVTPLEHVREEVMW